jgi:hypothetical protein
MRWKQKKRRKEMNNTLVNVQEVINTAQISTRSSQLDIERLLFQVEDTLANNVIGRTFYDTLLSTKAVYTTTRFLESATYAIGDAVKYAGLVYVSQANQTGVKPTLANVENGLWSIATKFTDANMETFYKMYLLELIACEVVINIVTHRTYRLDETGVTRSQNQNTISTGVNDLRHYTDEMRNRSRAITNNMHEYILRQKASGSTLFNTYKETDNLDSPLKRKRNTRKITFKNINI